MGKLAATVLQQKRGCDRYRASVPCSGVVQIPAGMQAY